MTTRTDRRRLQRVIGVSKAVFDEWNAAFPSMGMQTDLQVKNSIGGYVRGRIPIDYVTGCRSAGYNAIYDYDYIQQYHAARVPLEYLQAARGSVARAHSFIASEILRYHAARIPAEYAFGHGLDINEFFILFDSGIPAPYIAALAATHDTDSIRACWAAGISAEYASIS